MQSNERNVRKNYSKISDHVLIVHVVRQHWACRRGISKFYSCTQKESIS